MAWPQVAAAATSALEHSLGMTCDPVLGLVQADMPGHLGKSELIVGDVGSFFGYTDLFSDCVIMYTSGHRRQETSSFSFPASQAPCIERNSMGATKADVNP